MRYEISIEGGFIGIPRSYKGEIVLGNDDEESILRVFGNQPHPSDEKIRDGLQYRIKIDTENDSYEATFADPYVPETIRNFIDLIKSSPKN